MKIKNKIFAFTLIELIVVISIIMILSSSGVVYFFDFIWSQKLKQELEIIKEDFKELDKDIKNYNIFDYSLYLNTITWWLAYTYYTNIFDTNNSQIINFDSNSWTWIIEVNWWVWDLWNIKISKNKKFFVNEIIPWNNSFSWSFLDEDNYKVSWYLSWTIINDIWIKYFSVSNLDKKKWSFLELTGIFWLPNKWLPKYTSLKITNIWNKKEFFWDWTPLNKVYLFFERDWREESILIKK